MPYQQENTPYLKGMMTLSILMLIFVLAEGELKPQVTIALIGLELNNPQVLGFLVWIALAWYTLRFFISGKSNHQWRRHQGCADEATLFFKSGESKHAQAHELFKTEHPETYGEGKRRVFKVERTSFRVLYSYIRSVGDDNEYYYSDLLSARLPLLTSLDIAFFSWLFWVIKSETFAQRYLPLYLAILALEISAAKYLGWQTFVIYFSYATVPFLWIAVAKTRLTKVQKVRGIKASEGH